MCSYSYIKKKTTVTPNTAKKAIDYLIENGYIKQKKISKKEFSGYEYQFVVPRELFLHFHTKEDVEPKKQEQEKKPRKGFE